MKHVTVEEAQTRLRELVAEAAGGASVVIEGDGASVRLVPEPAARPRPVFGRGREDVIVHEDFEEPLTDFDGYAP